MGKKSKQFFELKYHAFMKMYFKQANKVGSFAYLSYRQKRMKYNEKTKRSEFVGVEKHFSVERIRPYTTKAGELEYPEWFGEYLVVSNSPAILNALQALGELPEDVGGNAERVLIFPRTVLERDPEFRKVFDYFKECGAEVIYDERESGVPIVCEDLQRNTAKGAVGYTSFYPQMIYTWETVDQNLLFVVERERFLNRCKNIWNSIVIERDKRTSRNEKITGSISRAISFANMLLLGRGNFDAMAKKAKTQKWRGEYLASVRFSAGLYDDTLLEASKSSEKLEAVGKVWERRCSEYWFRLTFNVADIDLVDSHMKERLSYLGHAFGIDFLLDTLETGIPIDNILAGGVGRGY